MKKEKEKKELKFAKAHRLIVTLKLKPVENASIFYLCQDKTHEPKLNDFHAHVFTCGLGLFKPVEKKEWICVNELLETDPVELNIMLLTFYNQLDNNKDNDAFKSNQMETARTVMTLMQTRYHTSWKQSKGFDILTKNIDEAEEQAHYHMNEIKKITCRIRRLKDLWDALGEAKTEQEAVDVIKEVENESNEVVSGLVSNVDKSLLSEIMLTSRTKSSEKRGPGRPRILAQMYCNPDPAKRGQKKPESSERKAWARAQAKVKNKTLYTKLKSGISDDCGGRSNK
jgi:hypothetical protein